MPLAAGFQGPGKKRIKETDKVIEVVTWRYFLALVPLHFNKEYIGGDAAQRQGRGRYWRG